MNIRVANKHDVADISNLVKSLSYFYLENAEGELPSWFSETLTHNAYLKRIQSDEYHNFIYEIEGEIAGYISLKGNTHLYHLFVSEAHQGKGISRCLWNHAIKECKAEVYTLRSSLFAIPIYKKFGFTVVGKASKKDGIGFQPMELRV